VSFVKRKYVQHVILQLPPSPEPLNPAQKCRKVELEGIQFLHRVSPHRLNGLSEVFLRTVSGAG